MIEELIGLAKQMRAASERGKALDLTEDELAFYDALEVNDSAVKVLGEPTLVKIARELVETVKRNVTIDWTGVRTSVPNYGLLLSESCASMGIHPSSRRRRRRQCLSRPRFCRKCGR